MVTFLVVLWRWWSLFRYCLFLGFLLCCCFSLFSRCRSLFWFRSCFFGWFGLLFLFLNFNWFFQRFGLLLCWCWLSFGLLGGLLNWFFALLLGFNFIFGLLLSLFYLNNSQFSFSLCLGLSFSLISKSFDLSLLFFGLSSSSISWGIIRITAVAWMVIKRILSFPDFSYLLSNFDPSCLCYKFHVVFLLQKLSRSLLFNFPLLISCFLFLLLLGLN